MAEYIEREALIKLCESKHYAVSSNESPFDAVRKQGRFFREAVDEAPAVDVVPRAEVAEIFDEIKREIAKMTEKLKRVKNELKEGCLYQYALGGVGILENLGIYLDELRKKYTEGE